LLLSPDSKPPLEIKDIAENPNEFERNTHMANRHRILLFMN
jgi:hypothetical protein